MYAFSQNLVTNESYSNIKMNFTLKRVSADENHNFSIKARVYKL